MPDHAFRYTLKGCARVYLVLQFVEFGERGQYSSPRIEPNPLPSRRCVSARMRSATFAVCCSSIDRGGWWPIAELVGGVTLEDFLPTLTLLHCTRSLANALAPPAQLAAACDSGWRT
jgi:hypothetical protein